MKKETYLVKEKDTKNKVKFVEQVTEGEPPVLETVYLPKYVAGDKHQIKVTIESIEQPSDNRGE